MQFSYENWYLGAGLFGRMKPVCVCIWVRGSGGGGGGGVLGVSLIIHEKGQSSRLIYDLHSSSCTIFNFREKSPKVPLCVLEPQPGTWVNILFENGQYPHNSSYEAPCLP